MMSRQGQPGRRQELVFCHQCENEWNNNGDPTGLTCPDCGSDFTEVIDNAFDPRAEQSAPSPPPPQIPPHRPQQQQQQQNPFYNHNPWQYAPDPDEEDIEGFGHHPQHQPDPFGMRTQQARGGGAGVQPGFDNPIFGMMQTIMGGRMGGGPSFAPGAFPPMQGRQQQHPPQQRYPQPHYQGQQQFGGNRGMPSPFPGQPPHMQQQHGQQIQGPGGPRVTSYSTPGGGYTISFASGPYFAMGSGRTAGQPMPQNDVSELLNGLFASFGGGAGLPGMFDPQNMRSGDAVYSQEALDRVISQLMDQNPRGNAPGPATDAAINSLPKTKLDVDMLDENTGQAECSICMSNVDIGEEITTLPCKHWYHFECIKAWLVEHDTCPVCRSGIMPKDGPDNIPRASTQQPLYSQDPASYLSRQQSGSREHPFVVDESPTRSRRAPQSQQGAAEGQSSGSSIAGMLASAARGFFGGDGANSQTGRGNNNGTGGHA